VKEEEKRPFFQSKMKPFVKFFGKKFFFEELDERLKGMAFRGGKKKRKRSMTRLSPLVLSSF